MKKHTIEHQGREIVFEVQRKKVKNVNLRVRNDSSVVVSAPERVPDVFIIQFVRDKAPWIIDSIRRLDQKRGLSRDREYKSGEIINYLGRQYRLEVLPAPGKEKACLKRDCLELSVWDCDDFARKEKLLRTWFREQAAIVFQESLDRMLTLFNSHARLKRPQLTIRTMKTRWGSCSWNRQRITLNTRLISYPMESTDYVVLHELTHFRYQRHDQDFYAFLSLLMPDWKARKEKLNSATGW